jgi:hypothetical protein
VEHVGKGTESSAQRWAGLAGRVLTQLAREAETRGKCLTQESTFGWNCQESTSQDLVMVGTAESDKLRKPDITVP